MYSELQKVLTEAYEQAAKGKGAERHANGKPFQDQPIIRIAEDVGVGFPAGQAMKKIREAVGASGQHPERAIKDLLGAINYTAATIILLRKEAQNEETTN